MKNSRLLEQHFSVMHPNGLSLNLGDSYLCRHNKIYRNIREKTVAYGYQYSNAQNEAYQALPLSQLSAILTTKIIPYLDNVTVLKQIENQMPNLAEWGDISDNLRKNFLFHESCHAVARAQSVPFKNEDKILNILMEESFANTCELLAVVDANEAVHRIFYEWNSYTALFDAKTNLKNAQQEIGEDVFAKLIFFGYLHSNFLFNSIDENQLNRTLKLVSDKTFSAAQVKTIKALLKICFTLDPRFKEVTTRFYMRLNGINVDYDKLSSVGYFESFEKNTKYLDYVNSLILVVTAA